MGRQRQRGQGGRARGGGRTRRRVRRNVTTGVVHIKSSFNNTIVSVSDQEGNVIAWESAGALGFKGSRKSTPYAAKMTAESVANKAMAQGVEGCGALHRSKSQARQAGGGDALQHAQEPPGEEALPSGRARTGKAAA